MTTKDKCREEFERWAKKEGYDITPGTSYHYCSTATIRAYNTWCAAWGATQNELHKTSYLTGYHDGMKKANGTFSEQIKNAFK